ncbi:MAG: ferrous iron transport protein B [Clostridiales bacterium]|jgi:ferrous iron transport protein B|nr:ferrous iron transport protein B [Clostridiales bacterium]
MIIALAGNPNSGKTTLFNLLTKSTAHVGNWPGVTVERREGVYKDKATGERHSVIDLPGIYSLSPNTPEEVVARNYLLSGKADVIINIVDATAIERSLYLTTQISELDCPVVIALNMSDVLAKRGIDLSADEIADAAGLPACKISALKNKGIAELTAAVRAAASDKSRKGASLVEQTKLGPVYLKIKELLTEKGITHPAFRAAKMLESDPPESGLDAAVTADADKLKEGAFKDEKFGTDVDAFIADARYNYICGRLKTVSAPVTLTERVSKADRILTHRIWGIPVFLGIMFLVFHLTFSEDLFYLTLFGLPNGVPGPGVAMQTGLGWLTGELIGAVGSALEAAPAWVGGLLVGGILTGVDSVLSFLPQILLLFLFLSLLEDTGYMARVAFIMDRAFRRLGLSGRAFMPLLMCFGCAVPGAMATRTLGNERERKLAVLLAPFFSCGAKLPVWAAVCSAVFPAHSDIAVFGVYVLGIAVAILAAFILGKTALKGEMPPFIMELPDYRPPHIRNTLLHLWQKMKHFLFRAATIIAGATVIIWFLSNFSFGFKLVEETSKESILGVLGGAFAPIFAPLGFGTGENGWKFVVAVFTGLIAKEMVVATMGVLAGTEDALEIEAGELAGTSLGLMLSGLSGSAAFAFMAFNLLSVPCMAAVAAAHAEFKNVKFTLFAIAFWIVTAYVVSLAVYQIGSMFEGLGFVGGIVVLGAAALVVFTLVFNFLRKKKGKSCCGGDGCGGCNGCG